MGRKAWARSVRPNAARVVELTQERSMLARFGVSTQEFRDKLKPLFLLMHKHGINRVVIDRDGALANTEIS